MKAITFLEWYVINEDNFYFNASGYLMTGEEVPISDIAAFYSQPFKPEMITELFDTGDNEFTWNNEFPYCVKWYVDECEREINASEPKTLDNFISDCNRAGIKELTFKTEITNKYFEVNNGLNNQKSNLRKATNQQNAMNAKPHKKGSSKFKGVSWNKALSKWNSKIGFNYTRIHIGYFNSETEATKAYNNEAKRLFGKFANLNII